MAKIDSTKTRVAENEDFTVKSVLITLPKPESDKSPYFDLARKFELKLDFYPFIRVEGLPAKEFRRQKVDINEFTAIVFTSRNAVDHFFRICEEMKIKVSQDMKYFCITEAVALYLQKFILYRKRKVFFSPDGTTEGLTEVIGKHKHAVKFIVPTTDTTKNDIAQFLQKSKIEYAEVTLFRTVSNDIEKMMKENYDMIVFFSPASIQAIFEYDPEFKQGNQMIGAFGPTTAKAVEDAGLRLDIKAPAPNSPSMASALEKFLAEKNK